MDRLPLFPLYSPSSVYSFLFSIRLKDSRSSSVKKHCTETPNSLGISKTSVIAERPKSRLYSTRPVIANVLPVYFALAAAWSCLNSSANSSTDIVKSGASLRVGFVVICRQAKTTAKSKIKLSQNGTSFFIFLNLRFSLTSGVAGNQRTVPVSVTKMNFICFDTPENIAANSQSPTAHRRNQMILARRREGRKGKSGVSKKNHCRPMVNRSRSFATTNSKVSTFRLSLQGGNQNSFTVQIAADTPPR